MIATSTVEINQIPSSAPPLIGMPAIKWPAPGANMEAVTMIPPARSTGEFSGAVRNFVVSSAPRAIFASTAAFAEPGGRRSFAASYERIALVERCLPACKYRLAWHGQVHYWAILLPPPIILAPLPRDRRASAGVEPASFLLAHRQPAPASHLVLLRTQTVEFSSAGRKGGPGSGSSSMRGRITRGFTSLLAGTSGGEWRVTSSSGVFIHEIPDD